MQEKPSILQLSLRYVNYRICVLFKDSSMARQNACHKLTKFKTHLKENTSYSKSLKTRLLKRISRLALHLSEKTKSIAFDVENGLQLISAHFLRHCSEERTIANPRNVPICSSWPTRGPMYRYVSGAFANNLEAWIAPQKFCNDYFLLRHLLWTTVKPRLSVFQGTSQIY